MQVFNIATLFNNLNHYVAARSPLEFDEGNELLSSVEKLTELAIQGYEQPIRDILQTRYAGKISGFNRITVGEKSVSGEFYDMYSPFRTTRNTFYISPTRIDIGVIGGSMPVYSEVDFAAAVSKTCGDGKKPCKVKRGSTEYFRCVPKTWKRADEKAALKGAIKEETKRAKSTGSSKPSPKEAKVIEGIIAKRIEAQQEGTRKSKNKYGVKPDATAKKQAKPEQRSLLEGMFPQSRNVPGADKLNDALGEINSRPSKVAELAGKQSTKRKKERKGKSDKVTDLFQRKLEEGDIVGAIDQSLLLADQGKKIAKEGLDNIRRNQQEIDQEVEDALKRFPKLGDDKPATPTPDIKEQINNSFKTKGERLVNQSLNILLDRGKFNLNDPSQLKILDDARAKVEEHAEATKSYLDKIKGVEGLAAESRREKKQKRLDVINSVLKQYDESAKPSKDKQNLSNYTKSSETINRVAES